MPCRCVVSTFAGVLHDIQLPLGSTVRKLKEAVASSDWGVPPSCQRLCRLDAVRSPGDEDPVVDGGKYGLCISFEQLLWQLQHGSEKGRMSALEDVRALGPRSDGALVSALVRCAGDRAMMAVQRAALEALIRLMVLGSEQAEAALYNCLSKHEVAVRRLAVVALGDACQGDAARPADEKCMAALCRALEDTADIVRVTAVRNVAKVARKDDLRVTSLLVARVADPAEDVRDAAVSAVEAFVPRGHQPSIRALDASCSHQDPMVRRAALLALGLVAEVSEESVRAIYQHTRDRSSKVKAAAVLAIAQVAPLGCPRALRAVRKLLEDDASLVREASLVALSKVARRGDCAAIVLASVGANDSDRVVRRAAAKALACIG